MLWEGLCCELKNGSPVACEPFFWYDYFHDETEDRKRVGRDLFPLVYFRIGNVGDYGAQRRPYRQYLVADRRSLFSLVHYRCGIG